MFIFKILSALIWNIVIFGGLLFLPAGTLNWWRGWVLLGVVVVGTVATMIGVFRDDDALLQERLKPPIQEEQPLADKILANLLIVSFLGLIAFIPLDVFRFHLFSPPKAFASLLGLLLFIIGWGIISLSFKVNTFAATAVKHQADRQQIVIDRGVYSVVRHPMYAGAVLTMVGMSLWLESYGAALLAIAPTIILVIRIQFEEQFLRQELQGYDSML
ncbi:isoprenylcysteine carboxylmethyltransferase family protein [Calothrix sp. FACHB-1219]|uniref:methyltransferase family protein n=1 Tax=unclassified Calothrix TaxID=2619626 RepID=UPI001689B92C|nr:MULTISPECIES: isoprenylcysteine carboxylmethyltransferase family protein [unclassified Calothrix]MBD2207994.1 isoprenylcysteine carboxylmethyltransferase family protein [Calothrix sp. FACHB-168]MBD2222547.1 isoprenylcysteine carboxylmethyltransferase family protein [Calothrix sp. FACHB-1219]